MRYEDGEHDHVRVTDMNENVLVKLTLYNESEKCLMPMKIVKTIENKALGRITWIGYYRK